MKEHLPKTATLLEEIAAAFGTAEVRRYLPQAVSQMRKHQRGLRRAGAALGERRAGSNIFCLPADFGWNDLGSWTALHEHHTARSSPPADGNHGFMPACSS